MGLRKVKMNEYLANVKSFVLFRTLIHAHEPRGPLTSLAREKGSDGTRSKE